MKLGKNRLNMWLVLAFGILILYLVCVVFPLGLILYKSVLMEDGTVSFSYFTKFFSKKFYWSTLVNSFKLQ
jgi:iron(III) transport system permease protein